MLHEQFKNFRLVKTLSTVGIWMFWRKVLLVKYLFIVKLVVGEDGS